MYGTASKLGKMLMHIKWIVLAKENNFRPVALYMYYANKIRKGNHIDLLGMMR